MDAPILRQHVVPGSCPAYLRLRTLVVLVAVSLGLGQAAASQPPADVAPQSSGGLLLVPMKSGVEDTTQKAQLKVRGDRIDIMAESVPAGQLLQALARAAGLNIVVPDDLKTPLSVELRDVTVQEALRSILAVTGCISTVEGNVLRVVRLRDSTELLPSVVGRTVKVFPLHYVRATMLQQALDQLRSPVGRIFVMGAPSTAGTTAATATDVLTMREVVVVDDLPEYVERIEKYLQQVDVPPKQIQLESRILEVRLRRGYQTGFQFLGDFEPGNKRLQLELRGFATTSLPQGFLFKLEGGELTTILNLLETTADARTLSAPRLLVSHGQQARIQVGRSLSYRVVTVTEVAQIEDVRFFDTGVVLRVTPYIDDQGRILMRVHPEVSQGQISEQTQLPEKTTTEAETTVVLRDGEGIIIGGLIEESSADNRAKVRGLGDLRFIGKLFRRDDIRRERREIIVGLLPHVIQTGEELAPKRAVDLQRLQAPLLDDALRPLPRPWEPRLPQPQPEELPIGDKLSP
jgi:type IV pilus assembly protein PilQ